MQLTDIHCHILPKVDDGPDTAAEAIELLEEEYKQGVRTIIVTPHYRREMFEPSMKRVLYSYSKMREIAREMGIRLLLGCEYHRNDNTVSDLLDKKRPMMAKGQFALIEFSGNDLFQVLRNQIYDLTMHGIKPIIAHIERYRCCEKIEKVEELKKLGAYIQLNADSVLGKDGYVVKKYCDGLMKADLVDFIASDAHNMKKRKPRLKKCAAYVSKKMGNEYAHRIFLENPQMIWKSRCTYEKD